MEYVVVRVTAKKKAFTAYLSNRSQFDYILFTQVNSVS